MDGIFEKGKIELLAHMAKLKEISEISANSPAETRREREKLIFKITSIAKKLDMIYRVVTEGFEKENKAVAGRVFDLSYKAFREIEEKEALLEEANRIRKETEMCLAKSPTGAILEYSSLLSKYSKCPVFWREDLPLENTFPAFPTDGIMQQSVLREM